MMTTNDTMNGVAVSTGAATKMGRRSFLQRGGAGALGGLTLLSAAATSQGAEKAAVEAVEAQAPEPVVDARFPCRIADGIWVIPDRRISLVPNIGIVEGANAVLVIDAGLTVESGRRVLEAARAIAGGRELILTVTHAHPEHTFGAQAFKDVARIYYNKTQRDYLVRNGEKLLDGFRGFLPAGQSSLLDGVRITPAGEVYEGDHATLDLGGRKVELWTAGIAHSPGDQVIRIPDQNVIFAGDLIEERMFPIVPFFPPLIQAAEIDVANWRAALKKMAGQAPRIIVPGHGCPGGVEIAGPVGSYLERTRDLVVAAAGGKAVEGEALRHLGEQIRGQYPTWERPSFIAPAIQYFAEQAKG